MTKDEIIAIIIKHKPYRRYCDKLCNYDDIANDLYQEFFMVMWQKTEDELNYLYASNHLERYCLIVILNKSREVNRLKIDNPLLKLSGLTDQIDGAVANQINANQDFYNHSIDKAFDDVMDFINTDPKVKQSDVMVLYESLDGYGSVKRLATESNTSYHTIRIGRSKLIKRIKEHVKI